MNAGLFGGTFNPFHNGHIGIIEYVRQRYRLNKIFFIPSATPPHKPDINLAPANDRFAMVKESLKGHKNFFASDRELTRKGPSFTIDTINEFKRDYGPGTCLFLLMGSDAFLDITTWKHKDQIFEAVPMIIMLRGELKNKNIIASFINENISDRYRFNKRENLFSHKTKQNIIICPVPRIDISSTLIRERIRNNESITDLVPADVEKIIRTKELYK